MTIPIKLVPTTGTNAELKEFAAADKMEIGNLPVLGPVLDIGGVPGGAIIESLVASTGIVTKFADGSMLVFGVTPGIDQTVANTPYAAGVTLPGGASFANAGSYTVITNVASINVSNVFKGYSRGAPQTGSTFQVIQCWDYVQTYSYSYIAFGRWK